MKTIHLSIAYRCGRERVVKWSLLGIYAPVSGLLVGCVFEYFRFLIDGTWTVGSLFIESSLLASGVAAFLVVDGLLRPLDGLPDLAEAVDVDDIDADNDGNDDQELA